MQSSLHWTAYSRLLVLCSDVWSFERTSCCLSVFLGLKDTWVRCLLKNSDHHHRSLLSTGKNTYYWQKKKNYCISCCEITAILILCVYLMFTFLTPMVICWIRTDYICTLLTKTPSFTQIVFVCTEYVNAQDIPTDLKSITDRAAQTLLWTELFRGQLKFQHTNNRCYTLKLLS